MGLGLVVMMAANLVVVTPVADLYSEPDEAVAVATQAIYGTNVESLRRHGSWLEVRTPDGYIGWAPAASLHPLGGRCYACSGRVARIESLFANIYREPDLTRHRPLVTVPFETRLEVAAEPETEQRRWIQLRLPGGTEGWIQRGDVSFDNRSLSIPDTVKLARRFLGLPYRWGGVSTFGFDCSGFTQMLCRRRGIAIPRDAAPQAAWEGMVPVERDRLEPGDLVFFGESPQQITHTGMYIGDGEFIHATAWQRPVVQVSRLDDPHWSQLLVACRRPRQKNQP